MTGGGSLRIPGSLLQVIFSRLRPLSYPHTDVIWLFCAKDSQDTLLNLRYLGYSSNIGPSEVRVLPLGIAGRM